MVLPNPATTHLTITTQQTNMSHVALFDMTGREIRPLRVLSSTGESVTLDVSGLPQGMYIGRVQGNTGVGSFKMMKE